MTWKTNSVAAVIAVLLATNLASSDAQARGRNGALAAGAAFGIVGALALGAAAANAGPRHVIVEEARPVYVERRTRVYESVEDDAPVCQVRRKRIWDDYREVWIVKRIEVCE